MTAGQDIKPRPYWWTGSTLTTVPNLLTSLIIQIRSLQNYITTKFTVFPKFRRPTRPSELPLPVGYERKSRQIMNNIIINLPHALIKQDGMLRQTTDHFNTHSNKQLTTKYLWKLMMDFCRL